MRAVINAILYLVVTGAQWRMLPKEYPKWQTVYHYFGQWRDDGTWQRLYDTLRAEVRRRAGRHKHPTAGCLDSQSVKTSQVGGVRGYTRAKTSTGASAMCWLIPWACSTWTTKPGNTALTAAGYSRPFHTFAGPAHALGRPRCPRRPRASRLLSAG